VATRRATGEGLDVLDAAELWRTGRLTPGTRWTCAWRRSGFLDGYLAVVAYDGCFDVIFKPSGADEGRYEIRDRVDLTHTYPTYGGRRWWFVCSGCARRCGKLFGGWNLRCRICLELTYQSLYESDARRSLRRASRIRRRLGGTGDLAEPFPERPKGMHQSTYQRLLFEAQQAEWRGARVRRRLEAAPRPPAAW
jgi:hypothetical protein